jgi:hypothetical protein
MPRILSLMSLFSCLIIATIANAQSPRTCKTVINLASGDRTYVGQEEIKSGLVGTMDVSIRLNANPHPTNYVKEPYYTSGDPSGVEGYAFEYNIGFVSLVIDTADLKFVKDLVVSARVMVPDKNNGMDDYFRGPVLPFDGRANLSSSAKLNIEGFFIEQKNQKFYVVPQVGFGSFVNAHIDGGKRLLISDWSPRFFYWIAYGANSQGQYNVRAASGWTELKAF